MLTFCDEEYLDPIIDSVLVDNAYNWNAEDRFSDLQEVKDYLFHGGIERDPEKREYMAKVIWDKCVKLNDKK